MTNAITYHAVYRNGDPMPRALFRLESDAKEWHDAPGLYSNARRKVVFDERPYRIADPADERLLLQAFELLRQIAIGNDVDTSIAVANAIEFFRGLSLENGEVSK